jgi:tetratricopeptide (TPR) repeat protein
MVTAAPVLTMPQPVAPAPEPIRAFSVIVPVFNQEAKIIRTLESIEASIRYFFQHCNDPVEAQVVVVNEGSSDRTLELITAFAADKPHFNILTHFKAMGAGPARNTGARAAKGDILLFSDSDDLYYPSHIYTAYRLMSAQPGQTHFELEGQQIPLPPSPVGVVRTGAYMADKLHPYWKSAIENTIPQNLCVRRSVHEFVEGFPESAVYRKICVEDVTYDLWIYKFFKTHKVNVETVEYIRYPGNSFDRQLKKFQTDPQQWQENTPPETQQLHQIRHKVEQDRIAYLLEKFKKIERTPEFMALLNWQELASDYLKLQSYPEAIALFEQGLGQLPPNAPTQAAIRTQLAVAYNNLGSLYHNQRQIPEAMAHFQKAIALQPNFGNIDLARLHYNVATTLRDQNQFQAALASLQTALQLEPQLAEAQNLSSSLAYKASIEQKGYEFNEDWFSHNIPHWLQCLGRFQGQADLNILEVGSWEGRSTVWLLDNLLTHTSGKITCIDTFDPAALPQAALDQTQMQTGHPGQLRTAQALEQRFDENMQRTGAAEKVTKLVGESGDRLRSLPQGSFDIAYLDASPIATDVLEDIMLTWGLIKMGGVIILDDYGFQFPEGDPTAPPRVAIDAFLSVYGQKVKVIHNAYQLIVEKLLT